MTRVCYQRKLWKTESLTNQVSGKNVELEGGHESTFWLCPLLKLCNPGELFTFSASLSLHRRGVTPSMSGP